MGTLSKIISGATDLGIAATIINALINSLNSIGNYSCATSQAVSGTATAPTAVPFDSNDLQQGLLIHSGTINPSRFTVTSPANVVFMAQLQVKHLTTGSGTITAWFRKNGTTEISNSAAITSMNGVVDTDVLTLICTVPMAATDYVELMVLASAAGEWNLQTTAAYGVTPNVVPVAPGVIMTVICLPV
jgi:hypothetical protein